MQNRKIHRYRKQTSGYQRGERGEKEQISSTGLIDYKLLCIKQISNKYILYSKGNNSHYLVITFNRV